MVVTYKQDMPPDGGYKFTTFVRQPGVKKYNGWFWLGTYALSQLFTVFALQKNKEYKQLLLSDINDAKISLMPLYAAENDRLFLRHLKNKFQAEKELMKDIPDWETGKLYKEKIYKTLPPNEYFPPNYEEFYNLSTTNAYGSDAYFDILH
ncbi:unnamed protein product [Gordionus sp. m RMFG-2023]|uniref:NADH dehydrogenase [ubiquinone] 1 alpha subcomplex subunit 13-like n=1 Tax=Gordionus sp. m RMFG-2023 TaxID=3053472 RepID=UPI0030E2EB35